MKLQFVLLLLILSSPVFSQGGNDIGNGGNGVVCYTDLSRKELVSVDLFDFWETSQVEHVPGGIQLGTTELTVQDKIQIAVKRLAYFDPTLAEEIKIIALSMANNIQSYLVTPAQLPQIDDANPRVLPVSPCFIEQFAVQWQDLRTGARRFAISEKFYNFPLTTNDTRAGLILHEAIYRAAILRGAQDSDGVRYFNFILATKLFEEGELETFVRHLQKASLHDKRCQLVFNTILNQSIYVRGETDIHACSPIRLTFKKWMAEVNHFKFLQLENLILSVAKLTWKNGDTWEEIVSADPSTDVGTMSVLTGKKIGWLKLNETINTPLKISTSSNEIACDSSQVMNSFELNDNEEIVSCKVAVGSVYISKYGSTFYLKNLSLLKLTEDKNLNILTLDKPAEMYFSGTLKKLTVNSLTPIFVDLNEKFISGALFQPFNVVINGVDTTVNDIQGVGPMGGALVKVHHGIDSIYRGLRVLKSMDFTSINKAQPFCQRRGYQESLTTENFSRVYVTKPEQFYDAVNDNTFEKADEFVDLLPPKVICSGTFEIKL